MKKIVVVVLAISLLLAGCAPMPTTAGPSDVYSAEQVTASFVKNGLPVSNVIVYDEKTDPNNQLGRPGGYISKVNFADTRIEQYDAQNPVGGTVEVFESEEDLRSRKEYIESIFETAPNLKEYIYEHGLALLRLDYALTPDEADEYKAVLEDTAKYASTDEIAQYITEKAGSPTPIDSEPVLMPSDSPVAPMPDPEQTLEPEPIPDTEPALGSRKHPASIGDTVLADFPGSFSSGACEYEITMEEIIRGKEAWDEIRKQNRFNEKPGDGQEYLMAKFKIKNTKDLSGEDLPFIVNFYDFSFAQSDYAIVENMPMVVHDGKLNAELYEGATTEGWVFYLVDTDEQGPFAIYQDAIWFSLGQ